MKRAMRALVIVTGMYLISSSPSYAGVGKLDCTLNGLPPEAGMHVEPFHAEVSSLFVRLDATPDRGLESRWICVDEDGGKTVYWLMKFLGIGPGLEMVGLSPGYILYAGFGHPKGLYVGPQVSASVFGLGLNISVMTDFTMYMAFVGWDVGLGASATITGFNLVHIGDYDPVLKLFAWDPDSAAELKKELHYYEPTSSQLETAPAQSYEVVNSESQLREFKSEPQPGAEQ